MGKDTLFKDQMENGDVLLILHPNTLQWETRNVKAVLSNVSILLDEPFSTDLITYMSYQFMKNVEARKDRKDAAAASVKAAKKLKNAENKTFRYQTKTGSVWGTRTT